MDGFHVKVVCWFVHNKIIRAEKRTMNGLSLHIKAANAIGNFLKMNLVTIARKTAYYFDIARREKARRDFCPPDSVAMDCVAKSPERPKRPSAVLHSSSVLSINNNSMHQLSSDKAGTTAAKSVILASVFKNLV